MNRVAGRELERLAVDRERHPTLEHKHELLAGVTHRLLAAVGARLDVRLRAGDPDRPVATRDVLQLEPLLRRERSSRRITVTGRVASISSTKKPTLLPSAAATFIRLAIVGVIPLFSILWTAAVDRPARSASWASDQPRSARAFATLAPISETVRSISGIAFGDGAAVGSDSAVAVRGLIRQVSRLWTSTIVHELAADEE
jgi:hypothetical protein